MSRVVDVSNRGVALTVIPDTTQKVEGSTSSFHRLTWKDKFSRFVYGTLGFHSVYHMLDIGLSNFLGLDILKHGTNIKSYLGISLRGADPKMGGTNQGVFSPGSPDCTNQFYVMPNGTGIHGLTVPSSYIQMASANLLGHKGSYSLKSMILGWCTPVLRFKFRPEEVQKPRFQKTDRIMGALFTTHSISPLRLGICGSLTQGIGRGMFWRMASNPLKVLSGAALIGGAAYIGKRTYIYVTSKPGIPYAGSSLNSDDHPEAAKIQQSTRVRYNKEETPSRFNHLVQKMDLKLVPMSHANQRILKIAGLALLGAGLRIGEPRNALEFFLSSLIGMAYVGGAAYAGKRVVTYVRSHPSLNARVAAVAKFSCRLLGAYWLGVC